MITIQAISRGECMPAIAIYTIAYSKSAAAQGDPAFQIFDCRSDPAEDEREVHHIQTSYNSGGHLKSDLTDLMSPQFNPYPQFAYLSFNVWEQGELLHPGLCDLTNALMRAARRPLDVRASPRNASDTLLYCNYWVGTSAFWAEFMGFLMPLLKAVSTMSATERLKIFSNPNSTTRSPYYPFIFERMFSTFLSQRSDIRALAYRHARPNIAQYCRNEMEVFLVNEWADVIDGWDNERSYTSERRLLFANLLKVSQLHEEALRGRKKSWWPAKTR
jgi:hypothetical protein